eukprot:SAG31_NODE_4315_length_3365_cov_1.038579_1_plen_50_part_00
MIMRYILKLTVTFPDLPVLNFKFSDLVPVLKCRPGYKFIAVPCGLSKFR